MPCLPFLGFDFSGTPWSTNSVTPQKNVLHPGQKILVDVFVFVFVMDSLGESGKGERDLGVEVAGEGGSM